MKLKIFVVIISIFQTLNFGCGSNTKNVSKKQSPEKIENETVKEEIIKNKIKAIKVGAERFSEYSDKIEGKNLALVVNQTSMIGAQHLVDTLLKKGAKIKTIFAPEHGFRGNADAGEKVKDGVDKKTGIKIQSLYGKNKKPTAAQLSGIDLVVFDIQDVGARFYTYISTMSYVMEACAENGVEVLILDRPNPNGHFVDGPVLEKEFSSFVGLHQVPVVHGMTIAEYAQMINKEGWLKNKVQCDLDWVLCENYDHQTFYELPVKPSPNLPNIRSIYLYPSLCFFEGTNISVGRGTDKQFQIYGAPNLRKGNFEFAPRPMFGAKYPKHEGEICKGFDLRNIPLLELQSANQLNINYLIDAYQNYGEKEKFFLKNNFINKLAGNDKLRKQILEGRGVEEIRKSWEPELSQFKEMRKQYLLY